MFIKIILNFFIGLLIGFIFEFIYRSVQAKKITTPKLINYQMYGLTGAFLVFLYFFNISLIFKIILMFIFPTFIEFITGYLYLKIRKIYLWNYSKEPFNFMGIICPLFSFYWFIISLIYYYLFLPLIL